MSEDITIGNVRLEYDSDMELYVVDVDGEDTYSMTPASLLNLKNCIIEDQQLEERALVELARNKSELLEKVQAVKASMERISQSGSDD